MGLDRKLLGENEHVVRHMRTHVKALVVPAMWLILIAGLLGAGLAMLPDDWRPWSAYVMIGLAVVLLVALVVVPFLRWWTTTYTMTNRRIITRRGILNQTGHDLPLRRINNVAYERSMLDRILGCGTLVFTTAAETPVLLPDVPDVERVHVQMTELLFGNPQDALVEDE